MPRTFWLFSIRRTTIIVLETGSNLTMIQGDLRHIDQSTTITNRDAFNIGLESTVIEQRLPSTMSPGKLVVGSWSVSSTDFYWLHSASTPLVYPNIPAASHEHDTDRTSGAFFFFSYHSWKSAVLTSLYIEPEETATRGSRPVEITAPVHFTVSLAQWQVFSCWHPYLRLKTSHFGVDERGSCCITAMIKKIRFTSVCKKIKRWIERVL